MKLCVVNYNTQRLTECCIRSFAKNSPCIDSVYVFDNSDSTKFDPSRVACSIGIEVIDNTDGSKVCFRKILDDIDTKYGKPGEHYGSAKHALSVQWLIENMGSKFVLADSDTLNKRDVSDMCIGTSLCCAEIEKWGWPWRDRVCPYLCVLDAPKIVELGIRYFNPQHMVHLKWERPKYDTGAWFLRDVNDHGCSIDECHVRDKIEHLHGGSWRHRDVDRFLRDNKHLYC